MQNRDGKMRGAEYIILGGAGVKYLPRGTLEVRSTKRRKILMDYGMIGLLGLPHILQVLFPLQSVFYED